MNENTLKDFEEWSAQWPTAYDLSKTPAMPTENPYATSETWKVYESWCASKNKYQGF